MESSGKLLAKSIGIGVLMSAGITEGIIVMRFERTTPYNATIIPMIM